MYRQAAERCRAEGVPIGGEPGGAVHRWVVNNCTFRPGTDFWIVLGITAEMADMEAQAEGFRDQGHRAAERAFANWECDRFGAWRRNDGDL